MEASRNPSFSHSPSWRKHWFIRFDMCIIILFTAMNVLTIQKVLSTLSLFLCLTVRIIYGYSTGAPTRACGNMTPGHGYPVNTSPAPYLVEISKTQYSPNERIYGEHDFVFYYCLQSIEMEKCFLKTLL